MRHEQKELFRRVLKGRAVIVGIGDSLRADDGLGPALVERLRGKLPVPCINAGNAPERYLGRIAREEPDSVLLIDAAHLGLSAGEYRLLDLEETVQLGLSTHGVSPGLLVDLLAPQLRGKVFLLGVQPARLTLGRGLSRRIKRTLRFLEARLAEAF